MKLSFKTANQEISDTSLRRIRELKFIEWSLKKSGVGQAQVNFNDHCNLYNSSVDSEYRLTNEDRGGVIGNLYRDGWVKKLKADGTQGNGKYGSGYTDIQFTPFAYGQINDPDWAATRVQHNKQIEVNCAKISKAARAEKLALAKKLKEEMIVASKHVKRKKKSIDEMIQEKLEKRLDQIVDKMLENYV